MNNFNFNLLIEKFYNDTYLVDQNACSSPHLIIWYGDKISIGKKQFWNQLNKYVKKKYNSPTISSIDKITKLHGDVIKLENFKKGETVAILTIKGELVAIGESLLSGVQINTQEKGIAINVQKVFMLPL